MLKKLLSPMLYLAEDFFEQPLIMRAMLGFGWLCIIVMLVSMLTG